MLFPSLFSEPFDPSVVRAKMSVDSAAQIDLSSLSLTSEEASTLYNLFRAPSFSSFRQPNFKKIEHTSAGARSGWHF